MMSFDATLYSGVSITTKSTFHKPIMYSVMHLLYGAVTSDG